MAIQPPIGVSSRGFYEAFFRLVRRILRSIAGESSLDKFDLLTLVTEIERILNDLPITELRRRIKPLLLPSP